MKEIDEFNEVIITNPGLIFTLIPKVMQDIGSISKDRKNEQQRYSFRGIEDFYQAAHPAMIKHGIFCAPKVLSRDVYRFEKTNDQGRTNTWIHVALEVEHRFYATDGSWVPVTTWGEGLDNSDKATNKAMSGAMKYALIELFCVPTKDIEDADRTSPETGRRGVTDKEIVLGDKAKLANWQDAGEPINTHAPVSQVEHLKKTLSEIGGPAKSSSAEQSIGPAKPANGFIEVGQATNFERTFKDALAPKYRKDADNIRHAWLKKQGIVDAKGEGTAKAITKENFYDVREEAVTYAARYSE